MENPNEITILDVLELAHSLRQEQLSIANERNSYIKLNESLQENSANASQIAWICAQQRQNLNNLITSKPDNRPSWCCQRANLLGNIRFMDPYRDNQIPYQHVGKYIQLFNYLHQNPSLIAECLAIADDLPNLGNASSLSKAEQINVVVQTVSAGLYGNSIHGKDVEMMLKLLEKLLELKIENNESPRRILGSSSFARMYYKFHESSLSAKLFLTAALHGPVMSVLIDDDLLLEVDTLKQLNSYTPKEKTRKFGVEDSREYEEKVRKFHEDTLNCLHLLANKFIKSLSMNWAIFPVTIRWLVQTMNKLLQQQNFDQKVINEILTDMVFGHFICPAVVSPDLYGISDAPVSETARFNLIQIGQILQMLALRKHQDIEGKFQELYRKLDKNIVNNLMEQLLENSYDINEMGLSHQLPTLFNIDRTSILITHSELNLLIQFLRSTFENEKIPSDDRKKLKEILDCLPKNQENKSEIANGVTGLEVSPTRKSGIISNLNKTKNKIVRLSSNTLGAATEENLPNGNLSKSNSNSSLQEDSERVLIIPLTVYEDSNKIALLSEEEVLNMNTISQEMPDAGPLTEKNVEELSRRNEEQEINSGLRKEKHARFSLNQDDVSIGNTSDNLEAVSEAPSNHSVASSLELEENNDNDNLSDMVSANVSGRGTPNISGRDTPSSQVIDGAVEVPQIPTPQMTKILNKARSDIEDKFCKFEIKKLLEGDETISIISDTWSTDVLASDSENVESSDRNFSTPLIPANVILPDHNFPMIRSNNLDVETQSESAWSTDVLASDSEKITEIDTDDNQSITARSDITDSTPRDQEVPGTVNRTPDSPFFAPRVPNIHFRPIDPTNLTPRTPESPSIRSFDDSPRLLDSSQNHSKSSDLPTGGMSRSNFQMNFTPDSFTSSVSNPGTGFVSHFLATPTTPSSIQQPRPLRQNSSESQTSVQSAPAIQQKSNKKNKKEFVENSQPLSVFHVSDPTLENFTEPEEPGIPTNPFDTNGVVGDLINLNMEVGAVALSQSSPVSVKTLTKNHDDYGSEMVVEHRRLSAEQRNANFDSRRNGMIDLLGQVVPIVADGKSAELPKDNGKTDEQELVEKTENLKISDASTATVKSSNVTANGGTPRSAKSTGAIPKSISFDATADKADRHSSYHRRFDMSKGNTSTGILSKIKQGFKNRKGNKMRHNTDENVLPRELFNGIAGHPSRTLFNVTNGGTVSFLDSNLSNGNANSNSVAMACVNGETTDDILAKYRRKPSSSSDACTSDSTGSNNSSSLKSKSSDNENRLSNVMLGSDTDCFANAKRKLRLVLSTSDCHACDVRNNNGSAMSPLLTYLHIQLAQALNQQNLQQISYVSEVLRCLKSFDTSDHFKLISELQKDLINRQTYLQYLIHLRQDVLSTMATISNFKKRLENDRELCNKHLVMVCVRIFLEKREQLVVGFQDEFNDKLVVDEKLELMEEFIGRLMDDLKGDGILQGMADWQLTEAQICVERILLQRLYRQVMFPNGDVNISSDQVLHDHIRKLSRIISPTHSSLRIPQRYLNEAPWPFAQQQILFISAYKTPQEKVQCVIRCIRAIMNLLSMASERVPAADDLTPVLIYVIIKANPPYLLSTIQYVECFIGKKLESEELYWWTQFSSAIQFIKTMEYSD